ncbi:MAG: choice-of-anchor D domain-containing protein, partial [Deltaproteobacteria bacterium]|nr:choice-of-anchor D domain-containing protein [Deltaproteobacteria bacterium]
MVSALLWRQFYQKRFILCFIAIVAILFLSPLYSNTAHATDVTLEWDPNPEPDIAGYEVYYGVSSGNYSDMIDVGNYTSCTIGDLETAVIYYFAAKAYNTAGYRSDYSDEVTYTPAEPVADIFVDPDTHYFGNVMVGQVSDVTFTVTNDGIADLHIGNIGGLSVPFSIVVDNCSGATLSQGDSHTFTVRFAPAIDASFDDTITIPSDDPDENPLTIGVHGIGTPEPIENQPPVADAGSNQTVNEGTTVTLNGAASYDPDDGIASYHWNQTSGTSVTLSNTSSETPNFVSPNVGPEGASLSFRLTVTDNGGLQSTDTCIVNVTWDNETPVADAGPNQTVNEGTTVTLDGTASYD